MITVPVQVEIVPDRLIFKQQVKPIIDVDEKFVFYGFTMQFSDDNLLRRVKIPGVHPNCDPSSGLLCLPKDLEFQQRSEFLIPTVISLLKTFNLDDSYFQPWNEFEWIESKED